MKIINRLGIPNLIFQFLKYNNYDYNPDVISTTQFLKSIREYILTKRHYSEIEVEASDTIWRLFGSAVHSVLESAKLTPLQEERLTVNMGLAFGNVSGKYDIVENNKIKDFKVTSVWTTIFGSREDDYTKQLSINRYLYYKVKGITLDDSGSIITIYRDWFESGMKRDKGGKYPKSPITETEYKLMSFDDTEQFIISTIKKVKMAEVLPDSELPECSNEERWYNQKQEVYKKCDKYCQCSKFCNQVYVIRKKKVK